MALPAALADVGLQGMWSSPSPNGPSFIVFIDGNACLLGVPGGGGVTVDATHATITVPANAGVTGNLGRLIGDAVNPGNTVSTYSLIRGADQDRFVRVSGDGPAWFARSHEEGKTPEADPAPENPWKIHWASGPWGDDSQIEALHGDLRSIVPGDDNRHWYIPLGKGGYVTASEDASDLKKFLESYEKANGPVTSLPGGSVPNFDLFRAQKAIELTRYNRKPQDVTEGFINASGSVDGQTIAPRRIFWQRWKPIGKPNGKVVVVSPGYSETGREFLYQVNQLNKAGYDVITMDHQWAGYTSNADGKQTPGRIDRGFGVARDVAATAAFASQVADADYANAPGHGVVLMGCSMGAGPGVVGALTLNDNGKIQLDGPQMPKGLSAAVEAPFFVMREQPLVSQFIQGTVGFFGAGGLPIPVRWQLPGSPNLTSDPNAKKEFLLDATVDSTDATAAAATASNADIQTILGMINQGQHPSGTIEFLVPNDDHLADSRKTLEVVSQLQKDGTNANAIQVASPGHILENDSKYRDRIIPLVNVAAGIKP
jgi:alpha-beta hydrolase superfamily lysophospholipase